MPSDRNWAINRSVRCRSCSTRSSIKSGNAHDPKPIRVLISVGMMHIRVKIEITPRKHIFAEIVGRKKSVCKQARLEQMKLVGQARCLRVLAGQIRHGRQIVFGRSGWIGLKHSLLQQTTLYCRGRTLSAKGRY